MSIAIGFVAEDGVLLCTDSQYSGGVKFTGRKIYTYRFECGTLSFALAGHEPFAKKAITDSGEIVRVNRESLTTINEIKGLVEMTIKDVCERYVDSRPPEEREGSRFQLLVAVATPREGARLFSSVGTALTEVDNFECFGAGYFVGHQIIQNAIRPRMNLEQVATIAIQALGAAKRYVDTVDGMSQFECIRHAAIGDTLDRHFPYDVASFLDSEVNEFQEESARLLVNLADSSLSDAQFHTRLERFNEFVIKTRTNWKHNSERSELFTSIRSAK